MFERFNFPLEELYLLQRYNSFLLRDWLHCWSLHTLQALVHRRSTLYTVFESFIAWWVIVRWLWMSCVLLYRRQVSWHLQITIYTYTCAFLYCIRRKKKTVLKPLRAPEQIIITHQQQHMAHQSAALWKFVSESPQRFLQLLAPESMWVKCFQTHNATEKLTSHMNHSGIESALVVSMTYWVCGPEISYILILNSCWIYYTRILIADIHQNEYLVTFS